MASRSSSTRKRSCRCWVSSYQLSIALDKPANTEYNSLAGTEMDFVESKLSSEFVFNNPNIKGTCGCGESFSM